MTCVAQPRFARASPEAGQVGPGRAEDSLRTPDASSGLIPAGDHAMTILSRRTLPVVRILKGEMPAGFPVMQPTKFELVVNLRMATDLDLSFHFTSPARADEILDRFYRCWPETRLLTCR